MLPRLGVLLIAASLGIGCSNNVFLDVLPDVPDVAACAVPEGGSATGDVDLVLSSMIVEAGTGLSSDACMDSWTRVGVRGDVDSTSAVWFRAPDAQGTIWTVEIVVPGVTAPTAGQFVSGTVSLHVEPFAPSLGHAELSLDGEFWVYVAMAGTPAALEVLDFVEFSTGAPIYQDEDGCGPWRAYDLETTLTYVPYGQSRSTGDYEIFHAGLEHDLGEYNGCADWFVASTVVGVIAR